MTTKKKVVLGLVVAVVVVVAAGLTVAALSLDRAIKAGVETLGPKIAGVPITVGSVRLSLLSGRGEVRGVVIGNPAGFKTPNAFELDRVEVALKVGSLLANPIVVRSIAIEGPRVTYEMGMGQSNIGVIQANVEKYLPASQAEAKPTKVIIEDFRLTGAQIGLSATLLNGSKAALPMPDVHLTDIGKKSNGATVGEAAAAIIGPLTNAIGAVVSNSGKLVQDGAKSVTDAASGVVDNLKGLFNGGKK